LWCFRSLVVPDVIFANTYKKNTENPCILIHTHTHTHTHTMGCLCVFATHLHVCVSSRHIYMSVCLRDTFTCKFDHYSQPVNVQICTIDPIHRKLSRPQLVHHGRQGTSRLQDMQCTYNVTFRSVRGTIVAVEKQ